MNKEKTLPLYQQIRPTVGEWVHAHPGLDLFSSCIFLNLCSLAQEISTCWLHMTFKSRVLVLTFLFSGLQFLAFESASLRICRHWKFGRLITSVGVARDRDEHIYQNSFHT